MDFGKLTARPVSQIEAEIVLKTAAVATAKAELSELHNELRLSQVADAKHTPHEWAGKTVERVMCHRGNYGPRNVTQTGVVTLCEFSSPYRYRGHGPRVGEWFVLSPSGKTAYSLRPNVANIVEPWKVV